jgi:hypothetical protein
LLPSMKINRNNLINKTMILKKIIMIMTLNICMLVMIEIDLKCKIKIKFLEKVTIMGNSRKNKLKEPIL